LNPDSIGIPFKLMPALFPFHLAFNGRAEIAQIGRVLHRICPAITEGSRLDRHFRMVMPEGPVDVDAIRAHAGAAFVLESVATGLRLRGQMVALEPSGLILFLGSPYVADARDLNAMGLTLEDLPFHDPIAELLTVVESKNAALSDLSNLAVSLGYQRSELEKRNRELSAEYAITQALGESRSVAQVGAAVLAPVCEIFDWEFGVLWLWDPPARVLRCASLWNASPGRLAAFENATRQTTIATGAGLAGRVFARGEPDGSADLGVDMAGQRAQPAEQSGLHGGFAFPIAAGGAPIGVLEFFGREARETDYAMLSMMRCVSSKIALFLKQTRAEAGMHRYAEDLAEARLRVEAQTLELIRTGEELARARDAALAANELKSAIVANLGHEIRTPVNGIAGLTGLVLETDLTADQRENLTVIKASAESLQGLLMDILDLSKIEAGKLDILTAPFSLRRTIRDALQPLGVWAASKSLGFLYRVEDDVPDFVSGDPGRLRQVLVNLTANAIKFTERGGVAVRVEMHPQNGDTKFVRFSVTDTGIGIPRERQTVIFEAFRQAEESARGGCGGTGVGLSISARLIELMGGNIELTSELGKGSRFFFTVPLGIATPASRFLPRDPTLHEGVPRLGSDDLAELKVLVADDNPVNRKLTAALLEKHGSKVTVVDNGVEAVAAIALQEFDLVLMDVQMPEMDGIEATAAIRAKEQPGARRLPIVAMTADARRNSRATCLAAGMDGYLRKPIRIRQLLAAIPRALAVREQPKTFTAAGVGHQMEPAI
jgi:signal transduction histidine kinase/CheY-like chemotaxis protein